MAISPLEINGAISRTQDYSSVKQNEDNKGMIDQQNYQQHFTKEINDRSRQVNEGENVRKDERKFDAKEKGSNEYSGNKESKKNKETNPNGKVMIKGQSSFDIKI